MASSRAGCRVGRNWVKDCWPAAVALDFGLEVQDGARAGGRQLLCIISDVFVDGRQACALAAGAPAQPYCDDRTWCRPELSP